MNKSPKLLMASLFAGLAVGNAQATFVDFDAPGIGNLTDVTTQYAAEGVTFSGVTDGGQTVNIEAADNSVFGDVDPVSPPNALSNFYDGDPFSRAHIMQIDFSSAASDVSFYYNPAGGLGDETVFNVYNTSDALIDSFSDPNATGDGAWYLESINLSDIGEVDIVNPTPGWGHYIDNLSFTESASAPDGGTTLALVGGAFRHVGRSASQTVLIVRHILNHKTAEVRLCRFFF